MHINEQQQAIVQNQQQIAAILGKWNKGVDGNGAHYIRNNDFIDDGIMCENCVYYLGLKRWQCSIVAGEILPESMCKLWVIPQEKLNKAFIVIRQLEIAQYVKSEHHVWEDKDGTLMVRGRIDIPLE